MLGELTEAVTEYQDALTAEDAALEELALNGQEADITETQLAARKADIANGNIDAEAQAEAAVAEEDLDLREAQAELATQRVGNSDTALRTTVSNLQTQINNSEEVVSPNPGVVDAQTISEFQNDLVQAENALSSDRNSDGNDQSVAVTLSEAITGYLEAGGTDVTITGTTTLSSIVAAVAAEATADSDDQAFDELLIGAATGNGQDLNDSLAALVNAEGNYAGTALVGANSELRTALREAATVAGQRAELVTERDDAETAFTTAPVGVSAAESAEVALDLSGLTFGGSTTPTVTLSVDGSAVTITPALDDGGAEIAADIEAAAGVSASWDAATDTLTVTSDTDGAGSSINISVNDEAGNGPVTGTDTGSAAGATLGAQFVAAQTAIEAREEDIQDVADAEADLADAQAALDEVETLVASYEDAVENREDAATVLEEEFGVENIVDLADSNEAGTTNEADLYIFSEDTDSGIVMTNFEADDQLFLGTEFTRVDIGADVDLTESREGNSSALEVFVQQDGANTILFVEQFEGAGNAQSNDELVQITLNGVNSEDLDFSAGFLSAAEVA